MKKKIYKLFLTLMVSLSLVSGPIAQHEIARMLEALSEASAAQIQELDGEDKDKKSEEIKKKKKSSGHQMPH